MKKQIRIFKSFQEQEMYFLDYFASLTPAERLRKLTELQKKNFKNFLSPSLKKISINKNFFYDGY